MDHPEASTPLAGPGALPRSIRYIKNGKGGMWWPTARARQQLHAGWSGVPKDILKAADWPAAEPYIQQATADRGAASRDLNALRTLLDRPSQHIWVSFEDRRLWWCTVKDEIHVSPDDSSGDQGHFWLSCDRPWSDQSMDGARQLFMSDLPGTVTTVAGYRGTVCKPDSSAEILRILHNETNPYARTAAEAREVYEEAITALIGQLHERDFELLVDLVLSRDGWVRIGSLGGSMADIDTEVENRSTNEIAFVQVKSAADQATFKDSYARFDHQRDRYARMIFAVHTPKGSLTPPADRTVQIWSRRRLAELVVRLGLGPWLERRV